MAEIALKHAQCTEIDETHTRVEVLFADADDIEGETQYVEMSLVIEHHQYPRLLEVQTAALAHARKLIGDEYDRKQGLLDKIASNRSTKS